MNDDVVRVARTDIARTALAPRAALVLPRLIVDAGPAAVEKFLEFFAARIAGFKHRLLGLQTRQSAAYKGMMALLARFSDSSGSDWARDERRERRGEDTA